MNANNYLQAANTATQHLKTICDNLKQINSIFPWFSFKNIVIVLIFTSTGIIIENKYQIVSSLLSLNGEDLHTELTPLLNKCKSDRKGNCLLRMQTENSLYEAEYIEEFLASEKQKKETMARDTPSIVDRAMLYENKILNKTTSHSSNIVEQDVLTKPEQNLDNKVSTAKAEQIEIIAVEFVSDKVFEEGIAASCTNSKFYERQIELKNPLNIENNTVIDVIQPINCKSKSETKITEKCGAFPRVQIAFSEASKLYPLAYNPEKNINTLDRCGLAQVKIIQNNQAK